jgi:adenylate cyclase
VRVERAFAFVDLNGFTAFTEREGDERAVDVLTTFRAVFRDVASNEGVRIAKWLGDGCMLVSVDVEHLVKVAVDAVARLEMQLPLRVRVGIASGEVILFEGDDHIGSAVNLAARLCDAAGPGEILVGPHVIEVLPPGSVDHVGAAPLPGFPIPVPAARLRPGRVEGVKR